MNQLPAQPNKSLIDGIAVLQELSRRGHPISGLELSRNLKMEKTRINRLLKTLAFLGLSKMVAGRKYVCGDAIHVLSAQSLYGSGLLAAAMPLLSQLQQYGHIVALGVLWRDKVSYLYHHHPAHGNTIEGLGGHGSYPVWKSSIGMALLAQQSDGEIRELYENARLEMDDGVVDDLSTAIPDIRAKGYADVYTDHHSLAVPVGKPPFAALALSGRIPDGEIEKFVVILKTTAIAIEEKLNAYHQS